MKKHLIKRAVEGFLPELRSRAEPRVGDEGAERRVRILSVATTGSMLAVVGWLFSDALTGSLGPWAWLILPGVFLVAYVAAIMLLRSQHSPRGPVAEKINTDWAGLLQLIHASDQPIGQAVQLIIGSRKSLLDVQKMYAQVPGGGHLFQGSVLIVMRLPESWAFFCVPPDGTEPGQDYVQGVQHLARLLIELRKPNPPVHQVMLVRKLGDNLGNDAIEHKPMISRLYRIFRTDCELVTVIAGLDPEKGFRDIDAVAGRADILGVRQPGGRRQDGARNVTPHCVHELVEKAHRGFELAVFRSCEIELQNSGGKLDYITKNLRKYDLLQNVRAGREKLTQYLKDIVARGNHQTFALGGVLWLGASTRADGIAVRTLRAATPSRRHVDRTPGTTFRRAAGVVGTTALHAAAAASIVLIPLLWPSTEGVAGGRLALTTPVPVADDGVRTLRLAEFRELRFDFSKIEWTDPELEKRRQVFWRFVGDEKTHAVVAGPFAQSRCVSEVTSRLGQPSVVQVTFLAGIAKTETDSKAIGDDSGVSCFVVPDAFRPTLAFGGASECHLSELPSKKLDIEWNDAPAGLHARAELQWRLARSQMTQFETLGAALGDGHLAELARQIEARLPASSDRDLVLNVELRVGLDGGGFATVPSSLRVFTGVFNATVEAQDELWMDELSGCGLGVTVTEASHSSLRRGPFAINWRSGGESGQIRGASAAGAALRGELSKVLPPVVGGPTKIDVELRPVYDPAGRHPPIVSGTPTAITVYRSGSVPVPGPSVLEWDGPRPPITLAQLANGRIGPRAGSGASSSGGVTARLYWELFDGWPAGVEGRSAIASDSGSTLPNTAELKRWVEDHAGQQERALLSIGVGQEGAAGVPPRRPKAWLKLKLYLHWVSGRPVIDSAPAVVNIENLASLEIRIDRASLDIFGKEELRSDAGLFWTVVTRGASIDSGHALEQDNGATLQAAAEKPNALSAELRAERLVDLGLGVGLPVGTNRPAVVPKPDHWLRQPLGLVRIEDLAPLQVGDGGPLELRQLEAPLRITPPRLSHELDPGDLEVLWRLERLGQPLLEGSQRSLAAADLRAAISRAAAGYTGVLPCVADLKLGVKLPKYGIGARWSSKSQRLSLVTIDGSVALNFSDKRGLSVVPPALLPSEVAKLTVFAQGVVTYPSTVADGAGIYWRLRRGREVVKQAQLVGAVPRGRERFELGSLAAAVKAELVDSRVALPFVIELGVGLAAGQYEACLPPSDSWVGVTVGFDHAGFRYPRTTGQFDIEDPVRGWYAECERIDDGAIVSVFRERVGQEWAWRFIDQNFITVEQYLDKFGPTRTNRRAYFDDAAKAVFGMQGVPLREESEISLLLRTKKVLEEEAEERFEGTRAGLVRRLQQGTLFFDSNTQPESPTRGYPAKRHTDYPINLPLEEDQSTAPYPIVGVCVADALAYRNWLNGRDGMNWSLLDEETWRLLQRLRAAGDVAVRDEEEANKGPLRARSGTAVGAVGVHHAVGELKVLGMHDGKAVAFGTAWFEEYEANARQSLQPTERNVDLGIRLHMRRPIAK